MWTTSDLQICTEEREGTMSDRLVGLFEVGGHFVYEDGNGGYEFEVNGRRVAIKKSLHNRIIHCIDDKSSVGSKRRRQEDQHSGPAAAAAAAAAAAPAAGGDGAAASNGDNIPDGYVRLPSGARYRIVTEGTGRVPTLNDRIKHDEIGWSDGFNGRDKSYDFHGVVTRVSDERDWWREAVLSMREGETRQIIEPAGSYSPYVQLRLVSIE
ncbi:unnamed protein product [Vitrella brassicaformis CCMP3155]|uniref:Uncharacterized protein n=1 Tax=Vitrella brassicaformis (strain CCMP3155) TaxID=1169540 RepID=A0A0G4H4K8_VITBC|nr:unnamed protein product [Vitrella brassicaformis CCMP3155]|eukprot:CEM38729.1 unnamed protein product [Vitrella brassicaformis CCMP3155]